MTLCYLSGMPEQHVHCFASQTSVDHMSHELTVLGCRNNSDAWYYYCNSSECMQQGWCYGMISWTMSPGTLQSRINVLAGWAGVDVWIAFERDCDAKWQVLHSLMYNSSTMIQLQISSKGVTARFSLVWVQWESDTNSWVWYNGKQYLWHICKAINVPSW